MTALPVTYHYIHLSLSTPSQPLQIRKSIQDSLSQSFGQTRANTYIDILWSESGEGTEVVIRVNPTEAPNILASIVTSSSTPRLSLIKESPFLPSLLSTFGSRDPWVLGA
ncbi:hypothetical protein JAAARDRAFT_180182 [Jaapia argillacea MUCL 33604]|uniref:Uncharacterized protein n=1 Tax=Jaapia argillacea MUCL 33604 TaxID=933084 RepID=A0A067PMH9_9AGAM|nr:hypothetical protein JAAARDRAFT_180182 [Jaapia argillacea MUCL 33604]